MQTEKETVTTTSPNACPFDGLDSTTGVADSVKARLSLDRLELLERTLKLRRAIGRVSPDVAELVHEMRE